MTSWFWLKELVSSHMGDADDVPHFWDEDGESSALQPDLAVRLQQFFSDTNETIETLLELGALYRRQGDIERAVRLHTMLILGSGEQAYFNAKALLELGKDFRAAGFVGRAMTALNKALNFNAKDPEIIEELAKLAAESGDYVHAAELYGQLGHSLGEAHYYSKEAKVLLDSKDYHAAEMMIRNALEVYPGSVEAWCQRVLVALEKGNALQAAEYFQSALPFVPSALRFTLIESMFSEQCSLPESPGGPIHCPDFLPHEALELVLAAISEYPSDSVLHYYGARLLLLAHRDDDARHWLEKALVSTPDFWPARMALLEMSMTDSVRSPMLQEQLEFFLARGKNVKRFSCAHCGVKREQIFFLCPKCRSWHSLRFRMNITE